MTARESTPSTELTGRVFVITHWSVVLRARDKESSDSEAAYAACGKSALFAQTVADPAEVEAEVQHLMRVFSN